MDLALTAIACAAFLSVTCIIFAGFLEYIRGGGRDGMTTVIYAGSVPLMAVMLGVASGRIFGDWGFAVSLPMSLFYGWDASRSAWRGRL